MTVTAQDGTIVTIDAPITLPQGDTMPIVLAQSATFDTTGLHDAFPFPAYYDQEYSKRDLQNMLLEYDHPGALIIMFLAEEQKNILLGKVDSTMRAILPQGETPPENNVTIESIMNFIDSHINRFGCDTEPDLRVLKANAKTGLYKTKRITTPEGWTDFTIDMDKPVSGAEKGLWDLKLAQYIYGARVFEDYFPYSCATDPGNLNLWQNPLFLLAQYMDEQNYHIALRFFKAKESLVADAPLLSYDSMVEVLRQRIQAGKLKSIYGLTLGYSVKIVKGDAFFTDDTLIHQNPDVRFVLVPEWEILGFDEKSAGTAASVGLEEPTKDMILEPERFSRYGLSYEVRMDAATGSFILDYESMEYTLP